MTLRRSSPWKRFIFVLVAVAGCASEGPLAPELEVVEDAGPKKDASAVDVTPPRRDSGEKPGCAPLQSAEPIPARIAVISAEAPSSTRTVFVKDLFNLFRSTCGGCHVDASVHGFHVDLTTFPIVVSNNVIDRITTEDPLRIMPPWPQGKVPSERGPDDPVSKLLVLLQQWMAAGSPADAFTVQDDQQSNVGSRYLMNESVGMGLTNIGNCVPNQALYALEQKTSSELDTAFALMKKGPPGQGTLAERIGLPEHIEDTDLSTFDEETLAREGVIAFAPAYPLWSDNARKIRHVRVPQGQSIRFHADTQSFEIPPNTRFYKTFLRRIIDKDGSERFRKIETRLIVARPDIDHSDGTHEFTALYGSYAWNDDETTATLVTDPLRNGEPFRDRLITYVTDEVKAQEVRDAEPQNLETALRAVGAIHTYAIPGSERCVQCHMGSPSQSFILGFTPLQVRRRPLGQSGVIEPAGPDELTQLQRLIDYGVITGMDSPGDVLPLELSEGDRKPRNDYELRAQGYMVGNCAHCHNPRGFPSVQNPVLASVLNFLPGPNGGVFQFPLDRTSPRISRSVANSVPMPYITPSLAEFPSPIKNSGRTYEFIDNTDGTLEPKWAIAAPWRSLIYRNVDTPFPYAADLALLPHMPMNVPGYDCRVPRIMGDWMVSIPAVRKRPDLNEYLMPTTDCDNATGLCRSGDTDTSPQPYTEVKPGETGYDAAVKAADKRLFTYHEGRLSAGVDGVLAYSRYSYCPDTTDTVDPAITGDRLHLTPSDYEGHLVDGKVVYESAGESPGRPLVWPKEGVPDHPHWVVTDITDNPGPYVPRRSDWPSILRDHAYPDNFGPAQRQIVELLTGSKGSGGITLTQAFRDYGLHDIPFGLWQKKDGCDFAGVPTVASFAGDARPKWLDEIVPPPPPDAPVYTQLPGAAVFNMICINCHGANADSRGRQADTLMLMSGGETRVANLRDGLFGPTSAPGTNRATEFAPPAGATATADDWAARYLVWMGLGGTAKFIPPAILAVVANTQVFGVSRFGHVDSANMLSTAQNLCSQLLARDFTVGPPNGSIGDTNHPEGSWTETAHHTSLIPANGDAELWARLCSIDNPIPVRAIQVAAGGDTIKLYFSFFASAGYPSDRPVGNDRGKVDPGLTSRNLMPWCIIKPEAFAGSPGGAAAHKYIDDHAIDGTPLPICPDELFPNTDRFGTPLQDALARPALDDWATRGSVNAGFSVFLYLDQVERGKKPLPPFDQCERLH